MFDIVFGLLLLLRFLEGGECFLEVEFKCVFWVLVEFVVGFLLWLLLFVIINVLGFLVRMYFE